MMLSGLVSLEPINQGLGLERADQDAKGRCSERERDYWLDRR